MASLAINNPGTITTEEKVTKTFPVTGVQISKFIFDNDLKQMSVSFRKTYQDDDGKIQQTTDVFTIVLKDYTPKNPPSIPGIELMPTDFTPASTDYSDLIGKNFTTFQAMCEILYGKIMEKLNLQGTIVYGTDSCHFIQ